MNHKLCTFCGGEVPATARKCMHCSEWLEPRPRPRARSRRRGPGWGLTLLTVLAGAWLLPTLYYGSPHPCGMLKKALMTELLATTPDTEDDWEAAGAVLGVALGGAMLDGILSNMTPVQCGRGLIDVWTGEIDLTELSS